jgi:hypothetical protein
MPIRPEHRFFYPIDWPQLSRVIRFDRAGGRCERCGRPHGRRVVHLGDGRWWDGEAASWRDGSGRRVRLTPGSVDILGRVRRTCVVRIPTKPAGDSDLKPAVIPRRSRPPARSEAGQ